MCFNIRRLTAAMAAVLALSLCACSLTENDTSSEAPAQTEAVSAAAPVSDDSTEKTASGYTATSTSKLFNASKVSYNGTASVTKTDSGTYPMGLDKTKFSYDGGKNVSATFTVEDGELKILRDTAYHGSRVNLVTIAYA